MNFEQNYVLGLKTFVPPQKLNMLKTFLSVVRKSFVSKTDLNGKFFVLILRNVYHLNSHY